MIMFVTPILCCLCVCVVSRSLQIPSHMTVLHVEQEVIGDDTTALDSVLECDVKRHRLMSEEKSITATLHDNRCVIHTSSVLFCSMVTSCTQFCGQQLRLLCIHIHTSLVRDLFVDFWRMSSLLMEGVCWVALPHVFKEEPSLSFQHVVRIAAWSEVACGLWVIRKASLH